MSTNITTRFVNIILEHGDPTGLRKIELKDENIIGYVIPRMDVSYSKKLNAPYVYFLIGKDEEESETTVYVGETDNFAQRIGGHLKKDFWNVVACFSSKDGDLTKSHVKYLEAILYKEVEKIGRAKLESGKIPNPTSLPPDESVRADQFAEKIKLLLPIAGFNFLKKLIENKKEKEAWCCTGENASAKGNRTSEGFVVFKESAIKKSEQKSLPNHIKQRREKMVTGGVLVPDPKAPENSYTLSKDEIFGSPSAAAAFVLGRNANGKTEWKNNAGQTLADAEQQNN